MPQVDFYILADHGAEQRQLFACRLAEKAWKLGHRIYIHTGDAQAAAAVDDLLWRFQPTSFVPHGADDADTPVAIGWSEPEGARDVLINLALEVPAFFQRFSRISEIVVQAPEVLQATRGAWRLYQERGCAPQRHDLRR